MGDERGALNWITADTVREAAACVRQGQVLHLGIPLSTRETPTPAHRVPMQRFLNRDGGDYLAGARAPDGFQFAEDTWLLSSHAGTHLDALGHVWYGEQLYGGFPRESIRSTTGAQHLGIEQVGGIATKGILLDVCAVRGGQPLAAGEELTATDLAAAERRAGSTVTAGCAVLIRTGWLAAEGKEPDSYFAGEPGIGLEAAHWLAERRCSLVAADNFAVEAIPCRTGTFAVHLFLIRDNGIYLMENVWLDELAGRAAGPFLFVVAPLPVTGGLGSPVNPIAVL